MTRSRLIVLFGTLGLAVLAVLSWFFVLSPQQDRISETNAQAASVHTRNAALEQQIAQLTRLKEQMPQRLAELAELKAGFPTAAQVPDVLAELRTTAAAAGVSVQSLTAEPPVVPTASATPAPTTTSPSPSTAGTGTAAPSFTDIATMPIRMTVAGGYPQLTAFLKGMETAPRAYLMTNATLTGTAPGGTAAPAPATGGDTLTVTGSMFVVNASRVVLPSPAATPAPAPSPAS